jgi:hypothetical protein
MLLQRGHARQAQRLQQGAAWLTCNLRGRCPLGVSPGAGNWRPITAARSKQVTQAPQRDQSTLQPA